MKKLAVLFLLFIFLFNTVGYYIAFKTVQYSVKREIKAEIKHGLDITQLTTIIINKKALSAVEWLENGKEMRYNGELFDVVSSIENSNSITYYCINDKQEEVLFANLDEHINRYIAADKPIKNNAAKKLIEQVVKLYFSFEENQQFYPSFSSIIHSSIDFNCLSAQIETNFLPPELA